MEKSAIAVREEQRLQAIALEIALINILVGRICHAPLLPAVHLGSNAISLSSHPGSGALYSTVTLLARFLGLSTSRPRATLR